MFHERHLGIKRVKPHLSVILILVVIGHGIGGKYIPIMAHLAKARCWSKQ
jgi:hypothetical protein